MKAAHARLVRHCDSLLLRSSENSSQCLLAVIEYASEIAPHERATQPPDARRIVDVIDHARSAGHGLEAMLVPPPSIWTNDLTIDEAHAWLPHVDPGPPWWCGLRTHGIPAE
jgi:hypothetical protein